MIQNKRKNHFFGSIVSTHNPERDNEEYQIIDGQQRLTTVSLLLLATYNLIRRGRSAPEDNRLIDCIYEDYLVGKYQPEETRIKLKPIKNDRRAFGKLFDEKTEHIGGSNLTTNYNYFCDRIQKEEITTDLCPLHICSLFSLLFEPEIHFSLRYYPAYTTHLSSVSDDL